MISCSRLRKTKTTLWCGMMQACRSTALISLIVNSVTVLISRTKIKQHLARETPSWLGWQVVKKPRTRLWCSKWANLRKKLRRSPKLRSNTRAPRSNGSPKIKSLQMTSLQRVLRCWGCIGRYVIPAPANFLWRSYSNLKMILSIRGHLRRSIGTLKIWVWSRHQV